MAVANPAPAAHIKLMQEGRNLSLAAEETLGHHLKMKYLIAIILFPVLTFADPAPAPAPTPTPAPEAPASMRSSVNSRLWFGMDSGFGGSPNLGGLSTSGALDAHVDLNIRYMIAGRCGPLLNYRNESMNYYDPVGVHNIMFGIGASCRVLDLWKSKKAMSGTHLEAHLLGEYGHSDYTFEEGTYYHAHHAIDPGAAVSGGAEFYVPLWVGFWLRWGVELEFTQFHYSTTHANTNEAVTSSVSTIMFMPHLGVSYSLF